LASLAASASRREELGDVVVDRDHAHPHAVHLDGHRRDLDVDQGPVLAGAPPDLADPLPPERVLDVGPDVVADLRRRDELFHPMGEGLRRGIPEEPFGTGIPSHHLAAEVHGDDGHRTGPHERLGVLLLALNLAEQSGVVDRQHRLGCEGLERRDDAGGEPPLLAPQHDEATEQPVFPHERHGEEGTHSLLRDEGSDLRCDRLTLVLDVRDFDWLAPRSGLSHCAFTEVNR
jgi:hypothetical protein